MTNSNVCSFDSKEIFTDYQIKEISEAIIKAVEEAMSKNYPIGEKEKAESKQEHLSEVEL